MRIINYKIIISILMLNISVFTYAGDTIEFSGKITEDTCSASSSSQECEKLSKYIKEIEPTITNLSTLGLDNDIAEITVENIKTDHHAVLLTNYY